MISVNRRSELRRRAKVVVSTIAQRILKSRVAFVDFMFMGQCGSLVLERFSAAVAKEAIEKIPLQFLSRNLAQQSVMCRGESRVSAHRGDSMLRHTGVHYAPKPR